MNLFSARSKFNKIFWAFFMALTISSIPHVVFAETADRVISSGMISTADALRDLSREEAQAKIETYLDRPDLQKELQKVGISRAEVQSRLATLSPAEMNKLAKQMDSARYGGDIFGILILVLLVVLIVFLVKRI